MPFLFFWLSGKGCTTSVLCITLVANGCGAVICPFLPLEAIIAEDFMTSRLGKLRAVWYQNAFFSLSPLIQFGTCFELYDISQTLPDIFFRALSTCRPCFLFQSRLVLEASDGLVHPGYELILI